MAEDLEVRINVEPGCIINMGARLYMVDIRPRLPVFFAQAVMAALLASVLVSLKDPRPGISPGLRIIKSMFSH